MKVAGFGFCRGASVASLEQVLDQLDAHYGAIERLAVSHSMRPLVEALGQLRNLQVVVVKDTELPSVATLTQSAYSLSTKGTGSVAEAVALLAAGNHAELLGPRIISADRKATVAVAQIAATGVCG
ncbi:cobalamin biosynthesis protein [Vreelandella olivaria]|uniref:cobalamin biosynthesis protein n=1 Tax=Vreelandella olivaria TaxID=390919 RepID=UPI00201EA6C5|nr:cobalamin biosynthesis protein [Halomonas olivaria]